MSTKTIRLDSLAGCGNRSIILGLARPADIVLDGGEHVLDISTPEGSATTSNHICSSPIGVVRRSNANKFIQYSSSRPPGFSAHNRALMLWT